MKILYAIQGTGNGHVSRAREIIPYLKKHGEVDLLISGTQAEVNLEDKIKYKFKGLGFTFGDKGGIDFKKTIQEFDFSTFRRDVRNLPLEDYNLIINDFEPVTALACRLQHKKSVALSHQCSFLSPKTPQFKNVDFGRFVLKNYAKTDNKIGFHFQKYDDFIHTPVIRKEIRELNPENKGHYTVYLPAYNDEFIIEKTKQFPNISWQVFSKHSKDSYKKYNTEIYPIDNEKFTHSLATCEGLLTGGGFEGPAEALFLGKKILSVPMRNQYEQQCNSLALEKLGIPVIWGKEEWDHQLNLWINESEPIKVDYPDETGVIISDLVNRFAQI